MPSSKNKGNGLTPSQKHNGVSKAREDESHAEMVQKHFGGGLDYVKENDLYEAYGNAVQKVSLWYGLGVTAERLHTLVAGMGTFKFSADHAATAANRLIQNSEMDEELRFRKLNPRHFFRALRQGHTSGSGKRGRAV